MAAKQLRIPVIITLCVLLVASACRASKETNLVFYLHDIESGKNITAITVAGMKGSSSSPLKFGSVVVLDDAITEGPDPSSPVVGRAQGIFVNSDLEGRDLHLVFSVVFQNDKYNGSTLEFQGADRLFLPQREVSVVGGTGRFRFARGYAVIQTRSFVGFNAILKFKVTIRTD